MLNGERGSATARVSTFLCWSWLFGMLLVSRSGLVEEDAVEVFHYYSFHLSSSLLMYNFKSFQGK
jgi:hypothetical protein